MKNYDVIFRKDAKTGEIMAFFPESYRSGELMGYAHIGQHFSADILYYHTTKKASLDEYNNLFQELMNIYGTGKDAIQLTIKQRMNYRRSKQ